MALLITVPKENNHFETDFEDAYFYVSDARLSTEQGLQIEFTFNAYPTRQIKIDSVANKPVHGMEWGGQPTQPYVSGMIYYYYNKVDASVVFPEGVPFDTDSIKRGVYEYFKAYLDEHEVPYKDVFETEEN